MARFLVGLVMRCAKVSFTHSDDRSCSTEGLAGKILDLLRLMMTLLIITVFRVKHMLKGPVLLMHRSIRFCGGRVPHTRHCMPTEKSGLLSISYNDIHRPVAGCIGYQAADL